MSDPDISIQEARPEGSSVPHEEPNQPEEILDPNRPETKPNWEKMEYRHLGNSGLRVSVLSYGNWANNDNADLTYESVKLCLENGINFFDTAEVYGLGKGEINLGKAIKKLNIPREKIVVSTKIYRIGDDPNDSFLSRKHIMEGLKNSLKRLQLDYVDILYCHRYDMRTPLEETCKAMNDLIEDEKILYWGTSYWTACQIMEAIKICNERNYIKPIVEQCQYNMIRRERMENEFNDLLRKYQIGISAFSPLYSGTLTGKYIKEVPSDSRYLRNKDATPVLKVYFDKKPEWDAKLNKLSEICKKLNCTLAQLAIAWVIVNPDVSTSIMGATKISQLEEDIKALSLYKKLDKNILLEIEKILMNTPQGEVLFRNFNVLRSRRNINLGVEYPEINKDEGKKKKKKPKKEEGEEGEGEGEEAS
jgi:voltage-dependent potassium channel beta subunit